MLIMLRGFYQVVLKGRFGSLLSSYLLLDEEFLLNLLKLALEDIIYLLCHSWSARGIATLSVLIAKYSTAFEAMDKLK